MRFMITRRADANTEAGVMPSDATLSSSRDEAISWVGRWPEAEGELELRQVNDLSDFAVDPAGRPD